MVLNAVVDRSGALVQFLFVPLDGRIVQGRVQNFTKDTANSHNYVAVVSI